MQLDPLGSAPYTLDSPQRIRIYERLRRLVGPGSAAFFLDACRLMAAEPPFAATTHLVGHAVREIESALRDVLKPFIEHTAEVGTRQASGDARHRTEIIAALAGLGIAEDAPVAQMWLALRGQGNEPALHSRAHRRALAPSRPLDDAFRRFWDDIITILDVVLDRFEARYIEILAVLDTLLAVPAPTTTDAGRLRESIPNNLVTFRYFFDRLAVPAWLEPLRAAGIFATPPDVEHDHANGPVRFLPWPQSGYLARMAADAPELVLIIALEIPETANAYVHEDLAVAAIAMPPALAARWAQTEARWIRAHGHLYFLLPDKLTALIVHLADGGEVDAALNLASALLALLPDTDGAENAWDGDVYRPRPTPRLRMQATEYEDTLRRIVPSLVSVAGIATVELLCDLLLACDLTTPRRATGAVTARKL